MRFAFLCAVILTSASGCQLTDRWGPAADDESRLLFFPDVLADPIKVLSKTDKDVTAVMTAGDLHLSEVDIDSRKYWRARLAGFTTRSQQGAPEIPHVSVQVKVPRNAEIRYSIQDQKRKESINLDADLSYEKRLPVHGGEELFASRDEASYSKEYGKEPIEIVEVSYSANEKVAVIKFYPLYYNPQQKVIQLTSHLKVYFYFHYSEQIATETAPVSGDGPGPLSFFHLNKSDNIKEMANQQGQPPVDLIIAAEEHRGALARYLNFKRSTGRTVIEHYVAGKSANQIKDIIATAYRNQPAPATTMLVGHIGQIPSFRGSGDNTWSDFEYTLLDQGSQPDVALGRVPAHNAEELGIFIDKAIARETAPRNVDQILLTSGKDRGMRCAENATEVGKQIALDNPRINMTHHSKFQGASQSTVVDGYNQNPNFVVYDGHGYQQGMSEIPLLIRDLDKLRNTGYPIILDIACLNANWSKGANSRNFAESILFSRTGGAAGILASGGSGYGHNFFRDIGKIMSSVRNERGTRRNEIGHVILTAKSRASSMQDKSYWNYYGDPASSVWESNATPQGGGGNLSSSIFVKLGRESSSPVLYAASSRQTTSMSYCIGDTSSCNQASSYIAMARVADSNGVPIFRTTGPVSLSNMMRITLRAGSPNTDLHRTITVRRK